MQQDVKLDIRDLLRFIRQGLLPALLIAAVAGYLAYQLADRREDVFEGQATLLAAQSNQVLREFGLSTVTAPPLDAGAYRAAATSDPVLASALARMGVSDPTLSDIRGLRSDVRVQIEPTESSSLIHVIGAGTSPSSAANRSNAVANALVEWDRNRAAENVDQLVSRLELEVSNLTDEIRSLQTLNDPAQQDQINGLISLRAERSQDLSYARALSESAAALLTIMQPATASSGPIAPRPMFNGLVAAFLGIALTYFVMLLRRAMDNRLRNVEDLVRVSGLPVLAEFPQIGWGDKSALREASSYLRTNLLFATAESNPKVLTVTSAQSGEGKSVTAMSLAEGFVRNGYRTLLIDADLRSPSIAKMYRIPTGRNRASLVEWLKDPYSGHKAVDVTLGPNQTLQVVPAFQPAAQPTELLSIGFKACLEKWRQEYDAIVVDTPPVLAVADTLAIAPLATGTLLVTHMQKTDRRQVRTAVDLLRRIGVRVLGIAATHVKAEHGGRQSYAYGYGGVGGGATEPVAAEAAGDHPGATARPAAESATRARRRTSKPSS